MVNLLLTTLLLLNLSVLGPHLKARREIVAKTGSMLPSIPIDSKLTLDESFYLTRDPGRFDIIVFRRVFQNPGIQESRMTIVARIVGLPGETIALRRGRVYINGRRITEPFETIRCPVADPALFWCGEMAGVRIPPGEYFVLADNRPESADSRMWVPKTVHRSDVVGKVVKIISPRDAESATHQIYGEPDGLTGDDCEGIMMRLDSVAIAADEAGRDETVIIVSRLGNGENARSLNRRRLKQVADYLNRRLARERIISAEGARVKGLGQLEFYVGGKLNIVFKVRRNKDLVRGCGEDDYQQNRSAPSNEHKLRMLAGGAKACLSSDLISPRSGRQPIIVSQLRVCAIARFARWILHTGRGPGVPLRSTPGFTLSPRSAG
ncbi:MAG TPA: signal peptidase I [Pyrinomonadaceae bacterium]|nr:signal peptidase I [Pyrinomonadaceae bacterium]